MQTIINLAAKLDSAFITDIEWTSDVNHTADKIAVTVTVDQKYIILQAMRFLKFNPSLNRIVLNVPFLIYDQELGMRHKDNIRCDVFECRIFMNEVLFYTQSKWDSTVQYESARIRTVHEEWGIV